MILVRWGEQSWQRHLLASVGGVDVKFLVVDSNFAHAVFWGNSDLHAGGEGGRFGGWNVEGINGGVLEDEARLCGEEDDPDKEYNKEKKGNEDGYDG